MAINNVFGRQCLIFVELHLMLALTLKVSLKGHCRSHLFPLIQNIIPYSLHTWTRLAQRVLWTSNWSGGGSWSGTSEAYFGACVVCKRWQFTNVQTDVFNSLPLKDMRTVRPQLLKHVFWHYVGINLSSNGFWTTLGGLFDRFWLLVDLCRTPQL